MAIPRLERMIMSAVKVFSAAAVAAIITVGATSGAPAHQPRGIANIVAETAPAIVTIYVEGTEQCRPRWQALWSALPIGEDPDDQCEDEALFEREGSGFVIDPAGYIVTNHHVIEDGNVVEVEFSPELVLDAEIIGADKGTDIALLKVNADSPLPFIRFGDSERIRVGDAVLAIGTPGIAGAKSATVGIVSARNRAHVEECFTEGYVSDFIQTDAAINPGNSGGPLLDTFGNVIGVISQYQSPDESYSGVGLAVPSRIAEDVVRQLRVRGYLRRGWLGFDCHYVDAALAESLALAEPGIAIVTLVDPVGPAAEAGLRSGDVILEYDNQGVREVQDLLLTIAESHAGRQVRVRIWRGERSMVLTARVGLLEEEVDGDEAPGLPSATEMLGMSVVTLDAELRATLGIDEAIDGALVTAVAPRSPAYRAEIEAGEVIETINYAPVHSARDLLWRVEQAAEGERDVVPVQVRYPGGIYFSGLEIRE